MKITYPATRLSIYTGGTAQMMNGGRTKRKETYYCLLEAAGTYPDKLEDILSDFRNILENEDITGDFFGTRQGIFKDVADGFLSHTHLSCYVAMLYIYADEISVPTVKKLYKIWDDSLRDSL